MDTFEKDRVSGIEIYDYTGENYKTVMRYGAWRVAYLNHGDCVLVRQGYSRAGG